MYTIFLDNRKFMLTKHTINKYPDSLLAKIINDQATDPLIIKQADILYIDRDPLLFTYIVDTYRGYEMNIENNDLITKNNINNDLKYFGLCQETVTLNILPVDDDFEKESDNGTHHIADILFQNLMEISQKGAQTNIDQLETYIDQINEKLKNNDIYDVIQEASNNKNIKEAIKKSQLEEQKPESDAESVDIDDKDE
jgi:hypothetical protein